MLGPWGAIGGEERYNARAGVMLACGHSDALLEMQYQSFCGGCTADALAAAPLFARLGPTVLAWKLVPAALHLICAGAGAWLARRVVGGAAPAPLQAQMLGAPGV